jgi:hypothetical protein
MVESVQCSYVNRLLKSEMYSELNITVFWDLTPCSLIDGLTRLHNITSQETLIFIFTAMRNSNINFKCLFYETRISSI